MTVFEKIEAQQKGQESSPVFMVGEQLKDICRGDAHCAEIVAQDLENKSMSLAACEKQIKAWADAHKPGTRAPYSGVSGHVAEKIIREFYGLPEAGAEPKRPALTLVTPTVVNDSADLGLLDLI